MKLFLSSWVFAIFDRNFAKIVAPAGDGNWNSLACLKRQFLLKDMVKTVSKSTHKLWHKTCSKYAPSNKQHASRPERDRQKETHKHHIFASTAGARCSIFHILHSGRGHRDHCKRWESFFNPTHSFFLQGAKCYFQPLSKNNTGSCHSAASCR